MLTSPCHEGRKDKSTKDSFINCFNYRYDRAKSLENGMPRGVVTPKGFKLEGFSEKRFLFTIIKENSIPNTIDHLEAMSKNLMPFLCDKRFS